MLVRFLVGVAFIFALVASAVFPLPRDLPAVALSQGALYRLEVALAVFYGLLLLLTPAHSGLTRGRLPTEISTRGAKFGAEADESVKQDAKTIEKLELHLARTDDRLANAQLEIDRLKDT
jgi:hypothetical protein